MPDIGYDLSLSQAVTPRPIQDVAADLGLERHAEPYGRYAAKLALDALPPPGAPRGKYIVVTAITPTPLGEGKTVTSIGLAMALRARGRRAAVALRQPSAGPVFGIKGGGAGGGRAQIVPWESITFHLTGDFHAIALAHNLLAAFLDNHVHHGNARGIDPARIVWPRVVDVCDRALASLRLLGGRETESRIDRFDIVAASEIMAILALATGMADLRRRLGRIVVGEDRAGRPVTAEELGCAGAMGVLLRESIKPNLMQTMDGTPAFIHTGPFGNIAHGNSSILADRIALSRCDAVVTEAGFGAELGFEKFMHIKCRMSGEAALAPDVAVLVCTVRGLKYHSGKFKITPGKPVDPRLSQPDDGALEAGAWNLRRQVGVVRRFGVPVVVAVNRFPGDGDREIERVCALAREMGAEAAVPCTVFADGASGGAALAAAVEEAARRSAAPASPPWLYALDAPIPDKIAALARELYGAADVAYDDDARRDIERWTHMGYGNLPVCMAKTQYSFSHDPKLRVDPRGYEFRVRGVRLSAGAGFLYPVAGAMKTMPGLPSRPLGAGFDIDEKGRVVFSDRSAPDSAAPARADARE